jgi:hypothetical protein
LAATNLVDVEVKGRVVEGLKLRVMRRELVVWRDLNIE